MSLTSNRLFFTGTIEELTKILFTNLDKLECTYKITNGKSIYVKTFLDYAYVDGKFDIYKVTTYSYCVIYNICRGNLNAGHKLYRYATKGSCLPSTNHLEGPDAYIKYVSMLDSNDLHIQEKGSIQLAKLGANIKYDPIYIDIIMKCLNKHCYSNTFVSILITTNLSIVICNIFSIIKAKNRFKYEHFVKMGIILDPMLYWCKNMIEMEYSRNCLKTLLFLCSIHDSFKMIMREYVVEYANKFILYKSLRCTGLEVLNYL